MEREHIVAAIIALESCVEQNHKVIDKLESQPYESDLKTDTLAICRRNITNFTQALEAFQKLIY